jgi:TPR repeat protein
LAISEGYRSARVDLGNLLLQPSAGMLDPERAVSLFEEAWNEGVPVAAFELGRLYEYGVRGREAAWRSTLRPNAPKAWLWYHRGADVGEPNALARFGERGDRTAAAETGTAKRDALMLDTFRYYAAAAERAHDEDWPDDAWQNWRYRRATLARLLARDGMMQQVADAYAGVREMWRPRPPTLAERIGRWLAAI